MTDIRITRGSFEVLTPLTTSPEVRVTRATFSTLSDVDTTPEVRLTRATIQVLASEALAATFINNQQWVNYIYPEPLITVKYFTEQKTTTHYLLENEVLEVGDFDWTFEFMNTVATGIQSLCGDLASGTRDFVAFNVFSSDLVVRCDNIDRYFDFPTKADGKMHKLRIVRTAGVMAAFDGTTELAIGASGSAASDLNTKVHMIGANSTPTNYFKGIISRVDLGNGTVWEMDKPFVTTTEQSAGGGNILTRVNGFAADTELFTLNTSTDPDQWENGDQSTIIQLAP